VTHIIRELYTPVHCASRHTGRCANPLPPGDTRFFFQNIASESPTLWIDDVKLQTVETASAWLSFGASLGIVNPGGQQVVQLFFNAALYPWEFYQADFFVEKQRSG